MTEGECSSGEVAEYILNCVIDGNELLDLRLFSLYIAKKKSPHPIDG
jgi:hypothetical protein